MITQTKFTVKRTQQPGSQQKNTKPQNQKNPLTPTNNLQIITIN